MRGASVLQSSSWPFIKLSPGGLRLLYWGAQHWTWHSRRDLTSAEQRRRIFSRAHLTMPCLMQSGMPLAFFAARAHCQLMLSLVSAMTPRPFSAKPLYSWVTPSLYLCLRLLLPRCGTLLALVERREVPVSPYLQPVQVPLDGSTILWCYQPFLLVLCHLQSC